jgi:hypothetical protein
MACRAALNAARSIGDEPIFVSQLVRIAGVVMACPAIERTLGQGEPPTEELSALQKLLEDEDAFPGLLTATRGERASMHKVFECVERGEVSAVELEGLSRSGSQSDRLKNMLISLGFSMDKREDHALFLSLITRYIQNAQLPMHEQAAADQAFDQEVRALLVPSPMRTAMITRLLLPAVSKMGEAFRRKHAYLRCAIVALASERYRGEKKTWPATVDQLCPQFLAAVPLDPYDGKPLRYRRVKDGVIIYSVGHDVTDNGGSFDREQQGSPGVDLGFRLWDVPKRRQPSKPKPAEPPQVLMPPG